jgi:hypothetical protein
MTQLPNPALPVTSEADVKCIAERCPSQSLKSLEMPVQLRSSESRRCEATAGARDPAIIVRPLAERAKSEPGWRNDEIDANYSPRVTAPKTLVAPLQAIATAREVPPQRTPMT